MSYADRTDELTAAPSVEADMEPEEALETAGGWSWLGAAAVMAMATAAVVFGFALGRMLRGDSAPDSVTTGVEPSTFAAAAQAPGFDLDPNLHFMVDQVAPEFTLINLEDGRPVSLSDYSGRPVLLNFWATWCAPCRFEMPLLQSAYEKHSDDGFVVLAANAGERVPQEMVAETVEGFVTSMGMTFPVLLGDDDGRVQTDYGVYGLPASFLIRPDGTIAYVHTGMYMSPASLDTQLALILE